MSIISVKDLLEAGVHFGHRVSRWNPKMAPYIFGKRNLIHIINLRETVRGLIKGYHFLSRLAADGEDVIFVGTKRQAKSVIKREAQRCNMHYVSERWLGGTLTNFSTIRKRLVRLEELEKIEQSTAAEGLSKKMASAIKREKNKIERNLEGIKKMDKLPGAVIIVDPKKEYIALKEASRLGIPTICLIDTDSDPDLVDIPIPSNDDAMRSIEVICAKLADAILGGHAVWDEKKKAEKKIKDDQMAAAHAAGTLPYPKSEEDLEWEKTHPKGSKKIGTGSPDRKTRKDNVRDGKRVSNARQRDYHRRPRDKYPDGKEGGASHEGGFKPQDKAESTEGHIQAPKVEKPADNNQPPQA